jgi:peptidoglycan/LPS O-acetylase OafA/YrhL
LIVHWGTSGVAIFFGISGFIITHLLVREQRDKGRVSLGAFYGRRALRILPPLWAYLAAIALFTQGTPTADFIRAFAFLTDYLPAQWNLSHTWSLSVEEKFYLAWPFLLSVLRPRHALSLAIALVAASPFVRAVALAQTPSATPGAFHLVVDAIMIGCLVSLFMSYQPESPILRWLGHGAVAVLSACYLLLSSAIVPRVSTLLGVDFIPWALSLRSLAVGSVLVWVLRNPGALVTRVLGSRPMTHIGVISYSLYLWQQVFCDPTIHLPVRALWFLRVAACFAAAELSHFLIERPVLSLRNRWFERIRASVASPGPVPVPPLE